MTVGELKKIIANADDTATIEVSVMVNGDEVNATAVNAVWPGLNVFTKDALCVFAVDVASVKVER